MELDFLLITSCDPLGSTRASESGDLALRLATSGSRVGVFLIQNGVVPARRGARWDAHAALVRAGVRIQADAFSLRERGIGPDALADGIEATDLAPVIDALGAGTRVLFT